MSGTLYIVATPIGNLGDISHRGIEVLSTVDFIAAEDTRVSRKLLNHFSITKPMVSYYEHNIRSRGEEIINKLLEGENCALISDAGTPAISDPGEDLVRLCYENNIKCVPIPGSCAMISALSVSGLKTGRFTFEGFVSTSKKNRKEHLESLKNETRTMIFYEAPHKLRNTLADFYKYFGNREISIVREITKVYEEVLRFDLEKANEYYENVNPKGEFVVIVSGAEIVVEDNEEDALKYLFNLVEDGYSVKDAAKKVSVETGVSKNLLYKKALEEE